jgi:hypothetical protein
MTMKTDDEEVIERVLELDGKAKEGPWAYENCGEKCNDIFIGTMCRIDGRGDPWSPESGCPETTDEDGNEIDFYREAVAHIDDSSTQGFPVQDAALIAEYRTAAPDLARRLRERNARIAVLEKQLGEATSEGIEKAAKTIDDRIAMYRQWASDTSIERVKERHNYTADVLGIVASQTRALKE